MVSWSLIRARLWSFLINLNYSDLTSKVSLAFLQWSHSLSRGHCLDEVFVLKFNNFYSWFKFYFPLFLGTVMYDNELKTKKNKI